MPHVQIGRSSKFTPTESWLDPIFLHHFKFQVANITMKNLKLSCFVEGIDRSICVCTIISRYVQSAEQKFSAFIGVIPVDVEIT